MSEYSMVTVPKQGNNPGMPRGKKNIVVIFDFDKATMERDEKGVTVSSLTMIGGATPIGLFVDQSSIDAGDEVEGEAYARGFIHHLNFDHPGTELAVAEFKANNVNANLGAIVIGCDASETTAKVYGTPCAPLTMQAANEQDTKDAHNNHFELKTELRTWPVGIIAKSAIPATDNADVNTFLGLTTPTNGDGQE